ncbi:hypothetical protein MU852_08940 [Brevundimonas albigilva]|uniref:Spore coat protein U domain-containing protein n=3 Tax=Brevundimonas TaxID=41275 RepID=A0ABY4SK23_9CAUL|nr:hypothetical protein [Brevundimonas albigilva]UQV17115.1 hypothetical protein MU852_08940 [Brevundimonas albigilva]URI15143.1 hypothetical protein M8231_15345 [Brevundimonas albigilva]
MSRIRISALMTAAAAAAATLLGAASAQAQTSAQTDGCRLIIESGADNWTMRYDPFQQDAVVQEFDVAVVNQGPGPCAAVSRVELRGEQFGLAHEAGGAQRMAYALVDERGGTDVTPRAGQSARRVGVRPLNLAPGERGLVRFSFTAAPSETLSAGLYSQNAFISLETPEGQTLAEKPVTLSIEVPSAAVMGLKGEFRRTGGTATIDLGELTQGVRPLRTTLYVLSTAGYSVSVSSENRGRLRQGASEWYVPYALALGDRDMDLGRGGRLDVVSRRARLDDYPLTISVGSVAGKRAGDYSDILTFTVAAL